MPIIMFFVPAIQVIAYILFVIPWMVYCIFMAASGEIVVKQMGITDDDAAIQVNYKDIVYTRDQKRQAWFMLFGYFWTAEFIMAAGQMITAMCLCCYYFTRDKSRIGNLTVPWGTWLVIRYHLGTIAFGSCVVAIVRLIRAYITYLEKYAGGGNTRLKKLVLRCLQCFMACIERCIKYDAKPAQSTWVSTCREKTAPPLTMHPMSHAPFTRYVNFNAYIQTCIWGTSFCVSGFNAFWLIFRNIARIAAVAGVTHFLAFIGKLAVILGTAGSFYYVMDGYFAHLVTSLTLPTLIVGFIATFIAVMFFEVFGMGTSVLLMCFIADEEINKDDPDKCFASGDLKAYLNKHGKSRKKPKDSKK